MVEARQRLKYPIFNGDYEIVRLLGEGNTSKVYYGRLKQPRNDDPRFNEVAIKIHKEEFLRRDSEAIMSVHNEITILKNMNQKNIV